MGASALFLTPLLVACTPMKDRRPVQEIHVSAALQQAVQDEIITLHDLFQAWFRGESGGADAEFARFERALAPGFTIVTPDGRALDRSGILTAVRSGYGRDSSARIWIESAQVRHASDGVIVATYEEWQQSSAEPSHGRLSTAILQEDPATAGAFLWLHVHETWLPDS